MGADAEERTVVDEDQTNRKEDAVVCGSKEQGKKGEEEAVDSRREDEDINKDGSKTHFVILVAHKDSAFNLIKGGYQYNLDSYVVIPVSKPGRQCKRSDVFAALAIDPNLASTEDRLEAFLVTVWN